MTRDQRLEYQRSWYQKNIERQRAAGKLWYHSNKERASQYSKEWSSKPENQERRRQYLRKWRLTHRERNNEQSLKDRRDKRNRVFALLGGKCVRCGFKDSRALQVDHIKHVGGGLKKRTRDREIAIPLYRAILRGDKDISRYQLLCANCNTIKWWEEREWGRPT